MNDPLGLFSTEESTNDPLGLFEDESNLRDETGRKSLDVLKGAGMAVTDFFGGIPGAIAGPIAGIGTAVANADPAGGLEVAKEVMHKSMPSAVLGIDMSNNPTYQTILKPLEWLGKGIETVGQGYGNIAGVLGAGPETSHQVASAIELGTMGGLASMGFKKKSGKGSPEASKTTLNKIEELTKKPVETVPKETTPEAFLEAKQADLFEPYTNSHRAFDQFGHEQKPLSFEEYKATVDNLATEKSTAFKRPEDLAKGYEDYLATTNERQAGLFDIGSRQDSFKEAVYQDQVPNLAKEHPFVKKAEERLAKQEELIVKLSEQVNEGKVVPSILAREMKNLEAIEKAAETTRTNVEAGLATRTPPTPFNYKRQGGAINPEVFRDGFKEIKNLVERDIKLEATSHQGSLTITAYKNGEKIGGAVYEPTSKYTKPTKNTLASTITGVNEPFRGKGLTREIYQFASELGNDVVPSRVQTKSGKGMWSNFEKSGLSSNKMIPKSQRGVVKVDWKKEKQLSQLKGVPGLKESLKDILPDTKTTEEFLATNKTTPDVSQNVAQRLSNYLTKGGVYQAIKTGNPLIKRVVDNVLEADQKSKALIQDIVHDGLAPLARRLSKPERTEVWAAQQIAERNKTALTRDIMEQAGMNEKQIAWVEAHTEVMALMKTKLDEALTTSGYKEVPPQVAYVASRSRGDFRRLVTDAEGEVVGILGSNTRHGLEKQAKQLQETHPEYTIEAERYFGGGGAKGGTAEAFQQMLTFLSKEDPKIKEFVTEVNDMLTKDAFDYMNAKSHRLGKKGIFGMEGRKLFETAEQNAVDGMQAQMKYAETMIKWAEMSKAVEQVKPLLKEDNGLNMPIAKEWSENYLQNALGNNPTLAGRKLEEYFSALGKSSGIGTTIPSQVVSGTRAIVNGLLLGWVNIPFMAANFLQPFKTNPEMMAWLKSKGVKKDFDFGTGYGSFAKATMDMAHERIGEVKDPIVKGALEYARENHVYSSDLFESGNTPKRGVNYYWNKGTQFGAAQVEQSTRKMTYLSYVHLLNENGLSPKDGLYQGAQRLTDMHMNNYSQIEAPKVYQAMGGLGKTAYNLMSYKHNELSRLAMMAREIPANGAYAPLIVAVASQVAFAGLLGTLGYKEANEIVKYLSAKLGKPTSISKLLLDNPDIPETIKYGMGSLGGIDLTSRIGLGSVIPEKPIDAFMPGLGKLGNIASAAGDVISSPNEFNLKNLAREAAPLSVSGLMDRAWFSGENSQGQELSMNRNKVEANAVRNDTDKMLKNFGATGINESKQKALAYENKTIDMAHQTKRKEALNNMAKSLFTDGQIAPKYIMDYVRAEGDINSLQRELVQMATEQRVDQQTLLKIRDAASSSITSLSRLKRNQGK